MNRSGTPDQTEIFDAGAVTKPELLKFPGRLDRGQLPTGPGYSFPELQHLGVQRLFLLAVQHCTPQVLSRLYTDLSPLPLLRPSAEMGDEWLRVVDAWADHYNLLNTAKRVPDWIYTAVMDTGIAWKILAKVAGPDWKPREHFWRFDNLGSPCASRILDENSMRRITSSGHTLKEIADAMGATYALLHASGKIVTLLGPNYYGMLTIDSTEDPEEHHFPVEAFRFVNGQSFDLQIDAYLKRTKKYLKTEIARLTPVQEPDTRLRRSHRSRTWEHFIALALHQVQRLSYQEICEALRIPKPTSDNLKVVERNISRTRRLVGLCTPPRHRREPSKPDK